jgi:hypothetical protein
MVGSHLSWPKNPSQRTVAIDRRVAKRCKSLVNHVPDFPVQSKGILEAADSPTMLYAYGEDFFGSRADCPSKNGLRVSDSQNHPDSATARAFRHLAGFCAIADPKLRAVDRQPRHDARMRVFQALDHFRSERVPVE